MFNFDVNSVSDEEEKNETHSKECAETGPLATERIDQEINNERK
jgi:hypothetical protein